MKSLTTLLLLLALISCTPTEPYNPYLPFERECIDDVLWITSDEGRVTFGGKCDADQEY